MTHCNTQLHLDELLSKPVVIAFDGGNITSDGGVLFLRQVDERLGLTERLADCLVDRRDPNKVHHLVVEQFRQRVYQIACGYED